MWVLELHLSSGSWVMLMYLASGALRHSVTYLPVSSSLHLMNILKPL